jgi:hypothetical protein
MNKIHWNIAGAFSHFKTVASILLRYQIKYNFTVYDGINLCSWNGGRINRPVFYDKKIHDFYSKLNVGIALTFSNPIIDLDDTTGNYLLDIFHDKQNSIILRNSDLTHYIKNKYSKYKLIYSVTGHNCGNPLDDHLIERYKVLESIYDKIVPRFEHVFDDRFIELDQSKYEIMTNDTCIYNCPHWSKHFQEDARINREYADRNPWLELGKEQCSRIEECWIPGFDPNVEDVETRTKLGDKYGMDLAVNQIRALIGRGITSFKISGRELKSEILKSEILQYLENL